MKIKIESETTYGPCGSHEKYAIMFLVVLFTAPIWVAFLFWLWR